MKVSGTGHRPISLGCSDNYSDEVYKALTRLVFSWLHENLSPEEEHTVHSGMALGFDTALCEAALSVRSFREDGNDGKLTVVAAVPFRGQEAHWLECSKRQYRSLLAQCDQVVTVCEGPYADWKMNRRNIWLVDHGEIILALWNGERNGGTASTVRYATEQNKQVVNLWDQWLKVRPK